MCGHSRSVLYSPGSAAPAKTEGNLNKSNENKENCFVRALRRANFGNEGRSRAILSTFAVLPKGVCLYLQQT
jgi:hypothetical protein